jgi:hypothetical protein
VSSILQRWPKGLCSVYIIASCTILHLLMLIISYYCSRSHLFIFRILYFFIYITFKNIFLPGNRIWKRR